MASIIIRSPGMLTTVQDGGRYGYQRFGMPVSGAMDTWSYQVANILVGNPPDAACLETTLTGPAIQFTDAALIAVCGADMYPSLNDRPIPMWETIPVEKDDILVFSGLKHGCRSYIAISGGIDVPLVMGSRSTYLRGGMGGFLGRPLKQGDVVPVGEKPAGKIRIRELPEEERPVYFSHQTVRIIPGPEVKRFGFDGIRNFLTNRYLVSAYSDRMGYRLEGPAIPAESGNYDIVSAGISAGTIQITGNGLPVILMADRQTTGGYARIANVISVDLPLVAQMKPGDTLNFREVSLDAAQRLWMESRKHLESLALPVQFR
jgi:antagonist of KipI